MNMLRLFMPAHKLLLINFYQSTYIHPQEDKTQLKANKEL